MNQTSDDFFIEEIEEDQNDTSYGMKSSSLTKQKNLSKTQNKNEDKQNEKDMWKCRVCFEDLNEPVVTLCGHIYCWECIYTWYTTKNQSRSIYYIL
jgi:E3 ubiquitin-protein ligase RNF5